MLHFRIRNVNHRRDEEEEVIIKIAIFQNREEDLFFFTWPVLSAIRALVRFEYQD